MSEEKMPQESAQQNTNVQNTNVQNANPQASAQPNRTQQIKTYLERLGKGEDLESVRKSFAAEFSEVDASEIMAAEQELLQDGTPLAEVQKLCDVHSGLFHGSTVQEMLARAEMALTAAKAHPVVAKFTRHEQDNKQASVLEQIPGHPLATLSQENAALGKLLETFEQTQNEELLAPIRELSIHYAKKGDLLYPLLKVKYDVPGPSEVMWTVDDEIRDTLGALAKKQEHDAHWKAELASVLKRAKEMIFKEQNILFPICAQNFSEEEWQQIYRDAKDYETCFGVEQVTWEDAEQAKFKQKNPVQVQSDKESLGASDNNLANEEQVSNAHAADEIVMPGGHLTLPQLIAMLNTLPVEITFVDAQNINRYFNEGPKLFKRPSMAIDRDVFSCHPPKIEPMVRQIIEDLRSGERDEFPVWMEKGGKTVLVNYMAVRSASGEFLGTLEAVQDMELAREHFERKFKMNR